MNLDPIKKLIEFQRTETLLRTLRQTRSAIPVQDAAKIIGSTDGVRLSHHIRRSMVEDQKSGRPFQASLIVSDKKTPLNIYFQVAQELGYDVSDRKQFWLSQLQKLGIQQNIARSVNRNRQGQEPRRTSGNNGNQAQNRQGNVTQNDPWYETSDRNQNQNGQNQNGQNQNGQNQNGQNQNGQNQNGRNQSGRNGHVQNDSNDMTINSLMGNQVRTEGLRTEGLRTEGLSGKRNRGGRGRKHRNSQNLSGSEGFGIDFIRDESVRGETSPTVSLTDI